MRMHLLPGVPAFVVLGLLAACQTPPPSAYVAGRTGGTGADAVSIGTNAVGEACTQVADLSAGGGRTADVFCGGWQQPSARVRSAGPADAGQLTALATSGAWRESIDARYACGAPTNTTVLGGDPAVLMGCTRRVGGWPHVAMVALVSGQAWFADGVQPALPVMERSIGVLAGVVKADAAPPSSAADATLTGQLAARAFGSGDVKEYERLMILGNRANITGNASGAETAFRAALAVQQKALGKDNPNTATAVMSLALALSNEGKFAEADALFAQAQALVPGSADRLATARLAHYRALNALNQGQPDHATALLTEAEQLYAAQISPEALNARPRVSQVTTGFSRGDPGDPLAGQQIVADPTSRVALVGLIEARRSHATALRAAGKQDAALAMLQSAETLAAGNRLVQPIVAARLYRTSGWTAALQGRGSTALSDLARSSNAFDQALPGSEPQAEVYLLRARELTRAGEWEAALPLCRTAVHTLTGLKSGARAALISPCLGAYAASASAQPAEAQTLLAEMFLAAQLTQGGITSQQISQATARLQENARDPKVGAAVRAQQDARNEVVALSRDRDTLLQSRGADQAATVDTSAIDKQIAEARAKLADSDAALQAASPNFGQLVQDVVAARDVLAVLRPDEVFVSIALGEEDGWVFALRDGRVATGRIEGGATRAAALVKKLRASIEETGTAPPVFDAATAQELYRTVLAPVAGTLAGAKRLTVAPSGPLLALPFEVLLTGPADAANLAAAPFLVRQFVITHVPAPVNFVALRRLPPSGAAQPWFGFGDFRPVTLAQARKTFPGATCADSAALFAGLPPLPGAVRELEGARTVFGGTGGDELLATAFTAPAVLKGDFKQFRVLHFATHAILPSDLTCQSEPAIITSAPPGAPDASGALLSSSQVLGMDLNADVIVLSACNSGGPGGGTAGESLSGLARSFFFAGARSLMVTHWSVNDQIASLLVKDTLDRLRRDPTLGIAGALRASQLALLDQAAGNPKLAGLGHPFYWAPFAVIGEGGGAGPVARTLPGA